jgi:hypothetical protein
MSHDLYQPEERCIYRYFDGEKVRVADPMILYKRMAEVSGDLSAYISLAYSPSKDSRSGWDKMVEKIRWIYDVKPFAEGGLLEGECVTLHDHFNTFCADQKKTMSSSPTTSTESSPSTPSSTEESPSTESTSASGSTDDDSCTEAVSP